MSGFDPAKTDAAFLAEHPSWRSFMLINLGQGDPASIFPRSPRLSEQDGEIHTVVPGRPIGLHPHTVAELG